MKKFIIMPIRNAYQTGSYELEAPDMDAAYVLAQDILLSDPRITWEEFVVRDGYPAPHTLVIEEVR